MIQTLSNLTIIIYAIAVMTMLLDTTPARLSRNKLSLLWAGAGIIALLQFFAGCVLGIKIYLRFYFFFAQLPVFLLFWPPSALFLCAFLPCLLPGSPGNFCLYQKQ